MPRSYYRQSPIVLSEELQLKVTNSEQQANMIKYSILKWRIRPFVDNQAIPNHNIEHSLVPYNPKKDRGMRMEFRIKQSPDLHPNSHCLVSKAV
mmetsp:Transcript_12854/g.23302  ORF Transcript_12854/g.23302 Transcript_12854/m.23302 type:complete len:94 (-) Transcript_12854:245-526(-)